MIFLKIKFMHDKKFDFGFFFLLSVIYISSKVLIICNIIIIIIRSFFKIEKIMG
jgi:hypothetical protein